MPVPYRDNLEATPIDELSCLVEVDRVYQFDWSRFDESDRQALDRIDEALPGRLQHRGGPWWFGDDEDVPPYLRATRVPAGLRVDGILPEADWWAWDERFRREADGLPCRDHVEVRSPGTNPRQP